MNRLLAPQTVAVIGASPHPDKIGHVLMRNLAGFSGRVYPVHPSADEVLGCRAYPSVRAIPETIDLALVAIPPQATPAALEDCATAGVGAAIIYSGGWAEAGGEGITAQTVILEMARAAGLRLLGPNTSGFVLPAAGLYATFVPDLPAKLQGGTLAIVSQSGGVNVSLCFLAQNEGLGVRLGIGLGNACDIGWSDTLDWLAADRETAVVALALEGVVNGRALYESLARLTAKHPVVAYTVGRSDVGGFAKSHTGVLTGSHRVKRAALAQAGAVVVDSLTELIDAAHALGAMRLTPRRDYGVGVVTGQAGPGLILTDELRARGISLPPLPETSRARLTELLPPLTYQENPVDTGRPGPTFTQVIQTVRQAEGIDLLAVSLLHEPGAVDPVTALANAAPCVLCSLGPAESTAEVRDSLRSAHIPVLPSPERAAAGVAALIDDARRQWRKSQEKPGSFTSNAPQFRPADGVWNEDSAKELVAQLGIAVPPRVVCATVAEAEAAFARLGPPVVAKILHVDIAHKTEAGGVHLNVRTLEELRGALEAMSRIAGGRYLIERMAPPGPELLIGARRDASFGPIVALGSGGIATEVDDDAVIRLAPLSTAEAATMLDELKSAARYRGFRGGPRVDEPALAAALAALGDLLVMRSDINEIEINPLRVTDQGLIALDALVVAR